MKDVKMPSAAIFSGQRTPGSDQGSRGTNMKSMLHASLCIMLMLACTCQCLAEESSAEPVSIDSLLKEMVNRDSIAQFPKNDFRLEQASSYNRESERPEPPSDVPKGWFANSDFNTKTRQSNLVRIEENNGRKEWVLMDETGPGAIVRSWMPWRSQQAPTTTTIIRFYLDGASEPAIEGNQFELFQGKGLVPYPLAHSSLRSAVSFFPIPYAARCKVTVSEAPFFFQFTYRKYLAGTPVKTFRMQDFENAEPLIEQVCDALLHPDSGIRQDVRGEPSTKLLTSSATLAPQQETTVDLPAGEAAIRTLSVKLGSYGDPSVTRSVVLKISFDGKQTVWCPVGDFFGSGIGLHPFQGWYRTVAEDGTMSCRWAMPYRESGTVSLVNLGNQPVQGELEVAAGDWTWDERSMYFHAAWRGQYPVPTRPFSDWNYVTLKGRGVYVGDTLTVMNPVERWWGEGDEKIFVDGESFPSLFGTGTEDYYAYSWGGRSTDFYEHPFHAQPRCNVYNKRNRKTTDERNTQGYSTETRTRALDTMPFGSSLQLDMEVWSGTDCDMGYGVGTYWYGDAMTTSNRNPDPEGAIQLPPLPDMQEPAGDTKPGPARSDDSSFENAVECETMKIVTKSEGLAVAQQNLRRLNGRWSGASHLLVRGGQVGDFVELRIPAREPITKKSVVLHATRSHDFGTIHFTVNGQAAGADVDLYSGKPMPSGPIELGVFAPLDNAYVLRAQVVGKNPKSNGVFFGLDCVVINSVIAHSPVAEVVENSEDDPKRTKLSTSSATGAATRESLRPPNFVVIFTDDQGYQDVGCFGSPDIRTPRLDAMARDGMKFTDFYAQPVCGPSRAALMTGCYPMRVAERDNTKQVHPILHSDEITVAELLKAKGYATACFGKWDLAKHSQRDFFVDLFPTRQGFDYFFGTPTSNDSVANLYRNEELIEPSSNMATLTRRYTDEAIGFMAQNQDKPFFVYLPHTMPHTRLDASEQFKGKSPRGLYGDVIEEIDFNVGRVIDAVKEMGLASNTYVLFTSDNGPWLIKNKDHADGNLRTDHGGSAGCLRSGKVSTFEGGVRVPTILWGPGRVPAGTTCDKLASTLDVLPTLVSLAGARVPDDRVIDGENISHLFHGDFDNANPDKTFFYYLRVHLQAVRQGTWKLHLPREAEPVGAAPFSRNTHIAPNDRIGFGKPFLVDLDSDVGETTNVADQHPDVVQRLLALAKGMREDLGDYDRVGKNMRFFDLTGQRPLKPPVPPVRNRTPKKAGTTK